MKERPILFSAPMVRAILAGTKTQTRRVAREPFYVRLHNSVSSDLSHFFPSETMTAYPGDYEAHLNPQGAVSVMVVDGKRLGVKPAEFTWANCPYGAPGDRLWVRETWRVSSSGRHYPSQTTDIYAEWRERPDGRCFGGQHRSRWVCSDAEGDKLTASAYGSSGAGTWRPSIHMPRWASRINLEVTGVRVERLQQISEEDARAEGAEAAPDGYLYPSPHSAQRMSHRRGFLKLWDRINANHAPWASNPWVWVVEFRRLP